MKATVAIDIDTDSLPNVTDTYLAQLWHVAQANPAPIQDADACELAELVGREIIRRFLANTRPELWAHQGRHHYWCALTQHCKWTDGSWQPHPKDEQA